MIPQTLGSHKDYVRALTHAPNANWVASGSFDQTIKVWDIKEMRSSPVMTIAEPSLQTSVYGLSTNAWGTVLAAATPEKAVRLWDPRSGKQIVQLVGHTDNVRSVVLSRDGSHLLSASSDSTIRLWSVAEQRCLHTFTHHNDSVWSLFSSHDSLDVFYSGDRSGVVCKVDWERCNEVSEGECVVLAKEKEKTQGGEVNFHQGSQQDSEAAGIYKIVAADNAYFWTASSNSVVSRWKDVPSRSRRETLYPIGGPRASSSLLDRARHARDSTPLGSPGVLSTRPSALKGHPNTGVSVPTSVSFAEQTNAAASLRSMSYDAPGGKQEGWNTGSSEQAAASMYGLPFDSLVCLAPPNDPYGAAIGLGSISKRTLDREDVSMLSSASLISIPSVLRAATSSHRNTNTATIDTSLASPISSHLDNGQRRPLDGARPASTKSASIRFAPLRSHQRHSSDEVPGSDEEQTTAGEVEEEASDGDDAALEARQAFEVRDSALDAKPLRNAPEDVIHGSHGLIRSSMLNDRRHVLTVDSAGHIFLWDIMSGQCLGAFDWYEVVEAWSQSYGSGNTTSHRIRLLPGEALDTVKERIQGEGTTPLWCTVDTKIGSLSVHFDYPRCFDAEIYLDEMENVLDSREELAALKEDQRTSMARLVLRNLFGGFVEQETRLRGGGETAPLKKHVLAMHGPREIMRKGGLDLKLDLERQKRPLIDRPDTIHTPGMTIALAIPAKTPAFLPIARPLTPKNGLGGLQHMLAADGSGASAGMGDYFSLQRSAGAEVKAQTPQSKVEAPVASPLNSPSSPGGTGLIGRLRIGRKRGDQNKKEDKNSASTPRPLGMRLPNGSDGEEEGGQMDPSTKSHLDAVRRIMNKADPAKVLDEFPRVVLPDQTAIMISESSPDSANFHVDYRGLVKSTGSDVATLELSSPSWLLEFLIGVSDNAPLLREKDKLTFLLMPWDEATSAKQQQQQSQPGDAPPAATATLPVMPAMPSGNFRLTATKMLRMKKACAYVADKLNILDEGNDEARSRANSIIASRRSSASTTEPITNGAIHHPFLSMSATPPSVPSSTLGEEGDEKIEAHEIIELLCNGVVLPARCTLAQVQRFYWKSSNVIRLEYRWKEK